MKPHNIILIVDDDPTIREVIQDALEEEGYRLSFARDGEEGLTVIRESTPDLVILDVMMPKLDGFGVLQAIQVDETLKFTKVIVLSAKEMPEAKVQGLNLGALDYIEKSNFRGEILRAKVARLLQLRFAEEIDHYRDANWRWIQHHLRTDANAIQGGVELLQLALERKEDKSGIKASVDMISLGTARLVRLVEQGSFLRDLKERGPACGQVNLAQMVNDLLPRLQPLANEAGISVDIQVPSEEDGFIVNGDEILVHTAFWAVLENAVHYSRANGSVRVLLYQDNGTFFFVVSDNGPGIDGAHLEHLFDPFYEIFQMPVAGAKGAGMSLPIAALAVRLCGAELQVESEVGQGSTFTFAFPIPGTSPKKL